MGKFTIFLAFLSFAVVTNSAFFLDNPFGRHSDPFQSINTFDGNRFGSNDLDDTIQTRSDVGFKMEDSKSEAPKPEQVTPLPTAVPRPTTPRPTKYRGNNKGKKYRRFDNDRRFDGYARSRVRKGFYDKN